jgi:hypothetical protein
LSDSYFFDFHFSPETQATQSAQNVQTHCSLKPANL